MNKITKALAVAAFGMAAAGAAQAQSATANFQVTANVQSACTVAATDLVFGNYVASAAKTSTSSVTVTCTNGTSYNVAITGGSTGRNMTGPGGSLNYGMYNDAGFLTAFGVAAAVGSGAGQAYTVHGNVPAGQFVQAGAYAETVQVVVAY